MKAAKEPDIGEVTERGIKRILAFIPFFENPESHFGESPQLETAKSGELSITMATLSDTAERFVEACYEENFVQPFDWPVWSAEHQDEMSSEGLICTADITTTIKMLTSHIRADRFSEGHLLSVMKEGTILRILRRLDVISTGAG